MHRKTILPVPERYAFIRDMDTNQTAIEACEKAIGLAGGPAKLAAALSVGPVVISSQAISQWKKVPPGRVIAVAQITGLRPADLRPDIFGEAPAEAAE